MLNFHTIRWIDGAVEILDQTRLPEREVYLKLTDYREVVEAIKSLRVRGAPLIGIAAAYAVVLAARSCRNKVEFAIAINEIKSARPTAVNLSWAVERMLINYHAYAHRPDLTEQMLAIARQIHSEDERMCEQIGVNGMGLMPTTGSVLTHCNAGALATGGSGTALSVIYHAQSSGKRLRVFACETRPVLQGARLSAWELAREGVDVTVITDNMAGYLMSLGMIDCVIVGADRIAINYDVANKIGTYTHAVLAKEHNIPFFVAAPTSTFDNRVASGVDIEIEQRDASEVARCGTKQLVPDSVRILNPAFDITPRELITAIITDQQLIKCGRWTD